jgi:CubicO group peptidase (beta-lactamase class C family)
LYLHGGNWDGEQVIPAEWVAESTSVDQASHKSAYYPGEFGRLIYDTLGGYYKYMWYGFFREGAEPDFSAAGDRGQYIYVSPSRNLIIVTNGTAYGDLDDGKWLDLFYLFASES